MRLGLRVACLFTIARALRLELEELASGTAPTPAQSGGQQGHRIGAQAAGHGAGRLAQATEGVIGAFENGIPDAAEHAMMRDVHGVSRQQYWQGDWNPHTHHHTGAHHMISVGLIAKVAAKTCIEIVETMRGPYFQARDLAGSFIHSIGWAEGTYDAGKAEDSPIPFFRHQSAYVAITLMERVNDVLIDYQALRAHQGIEPNAQLVDSVQTFMRQTRILMEILVEDNWVEPKQPLHANMNAFDFCTAWMPYISEIYGTHLPETIEEWSTGGGSAPFSQDDSFEQAIEWRFRGWTEGCTGCVGSKCRRLFCGLFPEGTKMIAINDIIDDAIAKRDSIASGLPAGHRLPDFRDINHFNTKRISRAIHFKAIDLHL